MVRSLPSLTGLCRALVLPLMGLLLTGCATAPLDAARRDFYRGHFASARESLETAEPRPGDRALFLMERGTIRQAAGEYKASSLDFIEAQGIVDAFQTYSLSKGSTSLVVNDSVLNFAGAPFERVFLHAMTALNHLAIANWTDAAVEARRIIYSAAPFVDAGFPQDAFSRYLAGFCLELVDDPSNAALQYSKASELVPDVVINASGRLRPGPPPDVPEPPAADAELVCFILLGRGPRESAGRGTAKDTTALGAGDAVLYAGNRYLGRSFTLADTRDLAAQTDERLETFRELKTTGRIALKEVIAQSVEHNTDNVLLGDLIRLVLIGLLERPDTRRWETLPQRFAVARVPCPKNLETFRVITVGPRGGVHTVHQPIHRRGSTYVAVFRDIQAVSTTGETKGSEDNPGPGAESTAP